MVWINLGGRRRGYGGYGGGYRGGFGGGYGGGGGGGCLRDLFLVESGCCLAEALGCGPSLVLLAPQLAGLLLAGPGRGAETRAVRLVRLYQERISPRRARPCCRMTPSCSAYAVQALHTHGTARGSWLTLRRLLRCRPGGPVGADPVPGAAAGA